MLLLASSVKKRSMRGKAGPFVRFCVGLALGSLLATGCAHYPVNQPLEQVDPQSGYRGRHMGTPEEEVNKFVFIVVNAETQPDTRWDRSEAMPSFSAMMSAYGSVAIGRYNEETIALIKERAVSWADELREQRCEGGEISTEPWSCGDIQFYVVEVKFDALEDEQERMYFKRLPTSFSLESGVRAGGSAA
jgi:hypothetical protein